MTDFLKESGIAGIIQETIEKEEDSFQKWFNQVAHTFMLNKWIPV
jgi:hypothetical protein